MQKLPLHKPYSNIKGRIYHHTEALLVFKIHNYTKVMISLFQTLILQM